MRLSRKLLLPALLALSPLIAAPAMADSLRADGFKYNEVTVMGIKDGQLQTQIQGAEKLFDLEKVEWINLDKQDNFNKAELERKDAKKSAALYKSALQNINDRKLKVLAELRAVASYDADDKFPDAITCFLDAYAASPTEAIWKLRPTKIPAATSTMLKDAADRIQTKLSSFKAEEAKKNLETFQLELLTKANDPRAAALAKKLATGVVEAVPAPAANTASPAESSASNSAAGSGLQSVSDAVKARNYNGAITQADNLLKSATGDTAVRLFELKSQALEGQKKFDEAAATLLRVVAHYPSSPNVIPDLMKAAELQKAMKHDEEAKHLMDEITALRTRPRN